MDMLISVIIVLIVVGLLMYILNKFLPLDEPYKHLINVIVLSVVIIWLLLKLLAYLPVLKL